jgi:protein tyrosine/serine phosphatase
MSDPNAFPLPTPPFILIEGLPNFRDIGGYPIASKPGKTVRRGVVFRSSEPSKVTDAGVALLQELRIRDVYDLRSKQEIEKEARDGEVRHVKQWDGSRRIEASVFVNTDYSPEAIALRFKNYANKSTEVRMYPATGTGPFFLPSFFSGVWLLLSPPLRRPLDTI